jgi:hypothetical protein
MVPVPADRADWRFQVVGTLASGFFVVDTETGVTSERHDSRVTANTACATANRAHYRGL